MLCFSFPEVSKFWKWKTACILILKRWEWIKKYCLWHDYKSQHCSLSSVKYSLLIIVLCNHKMKSGQRIYNPTWMHPPVSLEVFGIFKHLLFPIFLMVPFWMWYKIQSLLLANQIPSDASCTINRLEISTLFLFTLSIHPSKDFFLQLEGGRIGIILQVLFGK